MKKKILLIILVLLLIGGAFIIGRQMGLNTEESKTKTIIKEETVGTHDIKKTLTSSGEVQAKTTEKLELETSYYFKAMCVEDDDTVKQGENLLEYTNGTYLTAPYDCSVTELNLPEVDGKFLNSHYVQISSNNVLSVTINVDESNINQVSIGQEAKIKITTLEKEYTGYVTNVASIANNGRFKVTIEFENDGNIKLGMTASVEMEVKG